MTIASAPAGYNYALSTNTPGQVQLLVTRPQFTGTSLSGGQLIIRGTGGTARRHLLYISFNQRRPALELLDAHWNQPI